MTSLRIFFSQVDRNVNLNGARCDLFESSWNRPNRYILGQSLTHQKFLKGLLFYARKKKLFSVANLFSSTYIFSYNRKK